MGSDESLPGSGCRQPHNTLCRSPRFDFESSQSPTPAEGDWILFMKTDRKQAAEADKPAEPAKK
jgi:hypothetical protein